MASFHGDARVRSAHGVAAVRRLTRVSNDIAVHLLEFDVMPGPSWSDLSSDSHASLSIVLEAVGGRVETRLKRAEPSPDGPFTMSFTPPGTPIWGCTDGVRRVRELRLDFDVSRVCEALGQQLIVPREPRLFRNDRLRHIAECLAVECGKPDRFSRLYIDSLTLAACIDFLRVDQENPIRSIGRLAPWQLRRVTEYISEHLSETVTLRDLAEITRLSQSQLGRAFKRSTGFSLHRWQLNARVAKAQELLLAHALPHAQIALATGFSEQSHFSRVFKRIVGRSPAAWQREQGPLLTA